MKQDTKKNNFHEEYKNVLWIRAITALTVVLGHALICYVDQARMTFAGNITFLIYSVHMAIFMSLSGYLYYRINLPRFFTITKENTKTNLFMATYIDFMKRKIKRLMIPFLFFFIAVMKPIEIWGQGFGFKDLHSLLFTHHLWFLYVLFVLFSIYPLLNGIVWKSDAAFAFSLICSIFLLIISFYCKTPMNHIFYYNFFFLFGGGIARYERSSYFTSIAFGICDILCFIILLILAFTNPSFRGFGGVRVLIAVCAIIMIYRLLQMPIFTQSDTPQIIKALASYSMGIYLFHVPAINIMTKLFGQKFADIEKGYVVIFLFFASIISSVALTYLLRKLHLQFLIGEREQT